MIHPTIAFSDLDINIDSVESRIENWSSLDREYLFNKLSFILTKSKTTAHEFSIFGKRFVKKPSDNILCLDNSECSTFAVSILERGRLRSAAVHISIVSALADFLFRALDEKPFYYLDIDPMIRYNDVEEQNS